MNKTIVAWAALSAAFGSVPAFAKVDAPAPVPVGGWALIGTTHAGHLKDHDTVFVTGPGDHFRALRLKVSGAPLKMQRMRVIYANGAPEELPLRFDFAQGSMSRILDLRGHDRVIRQVDFWYETKGWLKGTAKVDLYGMH